MITISKAGIVMKDGIVLTVFKYQEKAKVSKNLVLAANAVRLEEAKSAKQKKLG